MGQFQSVTQEPEAPSPFGRWPLPRPRVGNGLFAPVRQRKPRGRTL